MKIVAIGGGELGTTSEMAYSLSEIDKEIVSLAQKAHPTLLFIGFNERANFIFGTLKKNYMNLGVMCTYLKFTELSNEKTVSSKFKRADIIFISGGNTIEYMKMIKKFGLDEKLKEAMERGTVLAGISAGAIIYHKFGSSDSKIYKDNPNKFTLASGLGFVDAVFCPHYSNSNRPKDIERFAKRIKQVAICADNNTALEIDDDNYKVIKSDENAKIFKCFYKNGKFYEFELQPFGKYKDLVSKN